MRASWLFVPLFAACSEPAAETEPPVIEPTVPEAAASAPPEVVGPPVALEWPAMQPAPAPAGDRLHSKVRFLWIRPKPDARVEWIGYLSLGESVRVKGGVAKNADAGPGAGSGCDRWYAIEPRGYVCAGEDATLDGGDPDVVELAKTVARHEPYPYQYGESLGTAVYLDVPPPRRQFYRETAYREHMANVARARQVAGDDEVRAIDPALVGVDLSPSDEPPPRSLLHLGPRSRPRYAGGKYGFPEVARGSTVATTSRFDAAGRGWLLTWDRGVIPRDRIRPYPASRFHGVALGGAVELPLAFFRRPLAKLRHDGSPSGERWPRYGWVGLTGEEVTVAGKRYLVTRERGLLCDADGVSVPRKRTDRPKGVDGQRTWVDISITGGWLVAYVGPKPVYATMISPGRGGLPEEGKTLLETASTPVGDYPLTGKLHTATMTSSYSDKVVHSEVPYTQTFRGPYALHAAYWHDDWGVGKSGGCVNLSPVDARRLFRWTEPRLPPGWHAMRGIASDKEAYARATVVSLHE